MFNLTPYRKHNEVSYYDPFQMMDEMERRFWGSNGMSSFKTDIRDEGGAYVLEEEKDKKGNYIRRERTWGSYSRSFDVSDINTAQIKAGYQNGVLTLNLPKRTETTPSSRTVAIE